jgi:ArsR family transcriptional regulator
LKNQPNRGKFGILESGADNDTRRGDRDRLEGGGIMAQDSAGTATDEAQLRELGRYFYALKEVWRLRMLSALAETEELTVSDMAQRLQLSQPLVSWHLRRLRQADIVTVRREGRESFYGLNRERIRDYQAELEELLRL